MPRKSNSSPQTRAVLTALRADADSWHYGYDLSRETGLKSGTLYPILMRLEAQGWLEARWEEAPQPGKPSRHLYRLTGLGLREAGALSRPATELSAAPTFSAGKEEPA